MSQSICASTTRHPPAGAAVTPTGGEPGTGSKPPAESQAPYRLTINEIPSAPGDPYKYKSSSRTYLDLSGYCRQNVVLFIPFPWSHPDMWSPIEPRHKRTATYSSKTIGSTLSQNCHKLDGLVSTTALFCHTRC